MPTKVNEALKRKLRTPEQIAKARTPITPGKGRMQTTTIRRLISALGNPWSIRTLARGMTFTPSTWRAKLRKRHKRERQGRRRGRQ